MNYLTEKIENLVNTTFGVFSQAIVEKYDNIEINDLCELWEELVSSKLIVPKTSGKTSNFEGETKTCNYLYQKGKRKGEICGEKPRRDGNYCSRHKKYEGENQKIKKVPLPKTLPRNKLSSTKKKSPRRSPQEKLILRNNKKLGVLWHPSTSLVFKSKNERIVVGKVESDTVVDLSEDDIDVCKKYGFRYERKDDKRSDFQSDSLDEKADESILSDDSIEEDSIEEAFNEIDEDSEDDEENCSIKTVDEKHITKALGLSQYQEEQQSEEDSDSSSDED